MTVIPPYALGAAGQVLSGKLLRHALGSTFRPSSAALAAASGVLQGPAGSMMELTLVNATTLRVNPGVAVVQGTQSAEQGQYEVVNDALLTLTVIGQNASQYRRSLVVVEVNDSQAAGVASSPTTDRARIYMIDGALSATGPGTLPALPSNALALGEVAIPPTGQSVTLTPYTPRTTTRGGVLAVANDTSTVAGHGSEPGSYVDQLRVRAGSVERWSGTAWLQVGIGANAPAFQYGLASTGSTAGGFQDVQHNSVIMEAGGTVYAGVPGGATIPVTGLWLFGHNAGVQNAVAGRLISYLTRNGSRFAPYAVPLEGQAEIGAGRVVPAVVLKNDRIGQQVFNGTGGGVALSTDGQNGETQMWGVLLRQTA